MNRPAREISTMTDSHVRVSPMVRPNPGRAPRRLARMLTNPLAAGSYPDAVSSRQPVSSSPENALALVDLGARAAFAEMLLLRLGPAAEHVVDREQLDLGEGLLILLGNLG